MNEIYVWTFDGQEVVVELSQILSDNNLLFNDYSIWSQQVSHDRAGNMLVTVEGHDTSGDFHEMLVVVDINGEVFDLLEPSTESLEYIYTQGTGQAVFRNSSGDIVSYSFDDNGLADTPNTLLDSSAMSWVLSDVGFPQEYRTFVETVSFTEQTVQVGGVDHVRTGMVLSFAADDQNGSDHGNNFVVRVFIAETIDGQSFPASKETIEFGYGGTENAIVENTAGEYFLYSSGFNEVFQLDFDAQDAFVVDHNQYWDANWESMQYSYIATLPTPEGGDETFDFLPYAPEGYEADVESVRIDTTGEFAVVTVGYYSDTDALGFTTLNFLQYNSATGEYVRQADKSITLDSMVFPVGGQDSVPGEILIQEVDPASDLVTVKLLSFDGNGISDLLSAEVITQLPISSIYPGIDLAGGEIAGIDEIKDYGDQYIVISGAFNADPSSSEYGNDLPLSYINIADQDFNILSTLEISGWVENLQLSQSNFDIAYAETWVESDGQTYFYHLNLSSEEVTEIDEYLFYSAAQSYQSGVHVDGDTWLDLKSGVDPVLDSAEIILGGYAETFYLNGGQERVIAIEVWDELTRTTEFKLGLYDPTQNSIVNNELLALDGQLINVWSDDLTGNSGITVLTPDSSGENRFKIQEALITQDNSSAAYTGIEPFAPIFNNVVMDMTALFANGFESARFDLVETNGSFIVATTTQFDPEFGNDQTRIGIIDPVTGDTNQVGSFASFGGSVEYSFVSPIDGSDWIYLEANTFYQGQYFRINSQGEMQQVDGDLFLTLRSINDGWLDNNDPSGVIQSDYPGISTADSEFVIRTLQVTLENENSNQLTKELALLNTQGDQLPLPSGELAVPYYGETGVNTEDADHYWSYDQFWVTGEAGNYDLWRVEKDESGAPVLNNGEYVVQPLITGLMELPPEHLELSLDMTSASRSIYQSYEHFDQIGGAAIEAFLVDTTTGMLLDHASGQDNYEGNVLLQSPTNPAHWIVQDWDVLAAVDNQNSIAEFFSGGTLIDLSELPAQSEPIFGHIEFTANYVITEVNLIGQDQKAVVVMDHAGNLLETELLPLQGDVDFYMGFDGYLYAQSYNFLSDTTEAFRIAETNFTPAIDNGWESVDLQVAQEQYGMQWAEWSVYDSAGNEFYIEAGVGQYDVEFYDSVTDEYVEQSISVPEGFWSVREGWEINSFILRQYIEEADGSSHENAVEVKFDPVTSTFTTSAVFESSIVNDQLLSLDPANDGSVFSVTAIEINDNGATFTARAFVDDGTLDTKLNKSYIVQMSADGSIQWVSDAINATHRGYDLPDIQVVPREYDGNLYLQLRDIDTGYFEYYAVTSDGSVSNLAQGQFETVLSAYAPMHLATDDNADGSRFELYRDGDDYYVEFINNNDLSEGQYYLPPVIDPEGWLARGFEQPDGMILMNFDNGLTAIKLRYDSDGGEFSTELLVDQVAGSVYKAGAPTEIDGQPVIYSTRVVESNGSDTVILLRAFVDDGTFEQRLNETYAVVVDLAGNVVMTSEALPASFSGNFNNFELVPRSYDGSLYLKLKDVDTGDFTFYQVDPSGAVTNIQQSDFEDTNDAYIASTTFGLVASDQNTDGSFFELHHEVDGYFVRLIDASGQILSIEQLSDNSIQWDAWGDWQPDSFIVYNYADGLTAREISYNDQTGELDTIDLIANVPGSDYKSALPDMIGGQTVIYSTRVVESSGSDTVILLRAFVDDGTFEQRLNETYAVVVDQAGNVLMTSQPLPASFSGSFNNFEMVPRSYDGDLYLQLKDVDSGALEYYRVDSAGDYTVLDDVQFGNILAAYQTPPPAGPQLIGTDTISDGSVFELYLDESGYFVQLVDGSGQIIASEVLAGEGWGVRADWQPNGFIVHSYADGFSASELSYNDQAGQIEITDLFQNVPSSTYAAGLPTEINGEPVVYSIRAVESDGGDTVLLLRAFLDDGTYDIKFNETYVVTLDRDGEVVMSSQPLFASFSGSFNGFEMVPRSFDGNLYLQLKDADNGALEYYSIDRSGNSTELTDIQFTTLLNGYEETLLALDSDQPRLDNGQVADETLTADLGHSRLDGYKGDDRLFGDLQSNELAGGEGNDMIVGHGGYDVAEFSGDAAEYIVSLVSPFQQSLYDRLLSVEGESLDPGMASLMVMQDPLSGSDGSDFVQVEALTFADGRTYEVEGRNLHLSDQSDQFQGGNGDDRVLGEQGSSNSLDGGRGDDLLIANGGYANNLSGSEDNDVLVSLAGADNTLQGGSGDDVFIVDHQGPVTADVLLSGDSGADKFALKDLNGDGINVDMVIAGFAIGEDKVDLTSLNIDYVTLQGALQSSDATMTTYDLGQLGVQDVSGSLTVVHDNGSLSESDFSFSGNVLADSTYALEDIVDQQVV